MFDHDANTVITADKWRAETKAGSELQFAFIGNLMGKKMSLICLQSLSEHLQCFLM